MNIDTVMTGLFPQHGWNYIIGQNLYSTECIETDGQVSRLGGMIKPPGHTLRPVLPFFAERI